MSGGGISSYDYAAYGALVIGTWLTVQGDGFGQFLLVAGILLWGVFHMP
ncbi:MAG: hypothetical protein V1787_00375 [Candidatus Micrarchaeota archaeon]